MDILLDTHALVWFLNGDKKLSRIVKELVEDPENMKFVSIASIGRL
ncbi:MAG: type II toxin-antitoxin system VapC family toxin [Chlorobi bacterium]|nr:type II toxin-antitoxin system VapC family toxin [Chlorobiota bacterium]